MKILIVGNRGMLGTDLMQEFRSDHQVWGVDRQEIDIGDASQCLSCVRELKPEIIINAAALTQVDYCESHVEEAFRVNGAGAGNLAAAAVDAGALLVHYSTDYVFDGLKGAPYLENDPPNPRSIYGKSKLQGEELVRSALENHLILRTSWLFGRHGGNFIATILRIALKEKQLRVVNDQFGSPTYARDLAAHTALMIKAACRGTYHATNRGSCSWYELAARCVEWAGMPEIPITPVTTDQFPRPAPRPPNSTLGNERLAHDGLKMMRPWQEAVRDYLQFWEA